MPHRNRRVAGSLGLSAAVLLAAALAPAAPRAGPSAPASAAHAPATEDPRPHCCFANPRYSGTCEVEPAKDESCASILAYLNNPRAQGKTYCGNTDIRGDWSQVDCDGKS